MNLLTINNYNVVETGGVIDFTLILGNHVDLVWNEIKILSTRYPVIQFIRNRAPDPIKTLTR